MNRSILGICVALPLVLGGCGGGKNSGGATAPRTTNITEDDAIALAMDAVEQNDSFADSADYDAIPRGNGWQVNVVDDASGAYRMVILDGDGKVIEYKRDG